MTNTLLTVVSILPTYDASTLLNADIPLRKLAEAGIIVYLSRLEHTVRVRDIAQADLIVLCRNVNSMYREIYELAYQLEIPMIYVLDDDIMGTPEGSRAHAYYNKKRRIETYQWLIDHASLIHVHSPVLQNTIHESTDTPTSFVWAPVDWDLTPVKLPELSEPYKIVYAATPETGIQLFSYIADDLHKILQKYPEKVEMYFLGYIPDGFKTYTNVKAIPFETNYNHFFYSFTREGYAIGLAPMIDSQFHKSKTDVKYRDYAAAGAVGIYMSSELYNPSVNNGETGIVVSGESGTWVEAIECLIQNPDLMQQLRLQARDDVYKKYHMDVIGAIWIDNFAKLPERPPLTEEKKRLLQQSRWDWFINAKTVQSFFTRSIPMFVKAPFKKLLGM